MTGQIVALLNATLESVSGFVPIEAGKPALVNAPVRQTDYGVLVGITGELKGRLFLMGAKDLFLKAGLAMYGMELPDDMVESFVGEFGNSVAGHTATKLFERGVKIDITPPTTMMGAVRLGGFSRALQVPFRLEDFIEGELVLAVEEV